MAQPICRTILLVLFLACPSWAAAQDPALMARADSLSHASRHHFDAGNLREAEEPLRSALAIDMELFGPDHLQTAHTMHDLGWLLYALGEVEEADSLLGRAESVYLSELGLEPGPGEFKERPRTVFNLSPPMPKRVWMRRSETLANPLENRARALNNVGWLLGWTWQMPRARQLLDQAVAVEADSLDDPIELAVSLHNAGLLRLFMGGPQSELGQQAVDLIDRSRSLMEENMERDPRAMPLMDTALKSSYYKYANTMAQRDSVLERSLGYTRENFGFEDWRTSSVLMTMARMRAYAGLLDDYHDLMSQATRAVEKTVGGRQPRLALTYTSWAGMTALQFGDIGKADSLLDRAVQWAGELRSGEVLANWIWSTRAIIAKKRGELAEAERWLRRVAQSGGEGSECADADLIDVLVTQGNLAEAEAVALKVREHARTFGLVDPHGALGRVYAQQGRFEEAAEELRASLEVNLRALGQCARAVTADFAQMAQLFGAAGRHVEAVEFARKALESAAGGSGPPGIALARAHMIMGTQLQALEGPEAAVPHFETALEVAQAALPRDHYELGVFVQALGENRRMAGTLGAEDLERLDYSIDVLASAGARPQALVHSLALRARVLHDSGEIGAALDDMEEALEILESLRPNVGGGEETRAGFFEKYAGYYDDMVTWLLEEGEVADAFEYAERGRARVMLDQLAAGQVDLRSSIPSDIRAGLEERESRARARVAEFEQRTSLLRGRIDLEEAEKLARLARLEDSLRVAGRDFQAVYQEIKNASPTWRGLVTDSGDPVSLSTVQRNLLSEGGLLLSYQIGVGSSVVFVVGEGRGQASAFPLEISEESAAALGVESGPLQQDALRLILATDEGVLEGLTTRSRVAGQRGPTTTTRLHALWQVLIPEEARTQLLDATEVILVPDDALHNLPFEALVVEARPTSAESTYWLDVGPPIRYAASATVLDNIEKRASSRLTEVSSALLSVADPVYDPTEVAAGLRGEAESNPAAEESPDQTAGAPTSQATLNRNSYTRAGGTLVRLPGTRVESDRVMEALGEDGLRETVVLRTLDATEARLRAEVVGKKYVHLATHGLVGGSRGALFASLALTPAIQETPTADNDGYLQLHEIYELPLDETELAVLSACETNVGSTVDGEGVFALSRGFLAAGARRVVASQWAVDDASTAELMGRFFEAVSAAEDDMTGSASIALNLAEAKKAVRSDERWSDPYYWAPFVLAGKR